MSTLQVKSNSVIPYQILLPPSANVCKATISRHHAAIKNNQNSPPSTRLSIAVLSEQQVIVNCAQMSQNTFLQYVSYDWII